MVKCRKQGVPTACFYFVDVDRFRVCMERISGVNLKEYLRAADLSVSAQMEKCVQIARMVGTCIAKMHDAGVVHGDLTTSNVMVRKDSATGKNDPVLIDFGLA